MFLDGWRGFVGLQGDEAFGGGAGQQGLALVALHRHPFGQAVGVDLFEVAVNEVERDVVVHVLRAVECDGDLLRLTRLEADVGVAQLDRQEIGGLTDADRVCLDGVVPATAAG